MQTLCFVRKWQVLHETLSTKISKEHNKVQIFCGHTTYINLLFIKLKQQNTKRM